MKTILFIQHASNFGGSVMSLLYTLQGIKSQTKNCYKLIIALAKWNEEIAKFYEGEGFEVLKTDWIDTYEHTQLVSYNVLNPIGLKHQYLQELRIKRAKKNTKILIDLVKPDLVHLNSVVLLGSAYALKQMEIPFVWHVREPSVNGVLGVRKSRIIRALKNLPVKCFFICKSDMESWGDPLNGEVVYNFVDFKKFYRDKKTSIVVNGCEISEHTFNILFLGGVNKVKGGLVLLKALEKVIKLNPEKDIRLIFPGSIYNSPEYFIIKLAKVILPLFGRGTHTQEIEKFIKKAKISNNLIRLPYIKQVFKLFQVSDVLIFPSLRPHFARPVIEAGAIGIPVIGSNLVTLCELIEPGGNGLLFKKSDVLDLTKALDYIVNNTEAAQQMGKKGRQVAKERYNQEVNIKQIVNCYSNIFY